ncbi:MAG: hypothetical protein HYZ14_19470 [Bacteroidetes bacterium]|nr:hypothetical protein [Bacteroidota bacterium]
MAPYNRLVLIGNGFDLALGLKTTYKDFVLQYLKNCGEELLRSKRPDLQNELLSMVYTGQRGLNLILPISQFQTIENLLECYKSNNINLDFNSPFFGKLVSMSSISNWVDFEAEYYNALKQKFNSIKMGVSQSITDNLETLNLSMDLIAEALKKHIRQENEELKKRDIRGFSRFTKKFFDQLADKEHYLLRDSNITHYPPNQTLFLNFNYTDTIDTLLKFENTSKKHILNIHGSVTNLENPIIFGYGDDTDEEYASMEKHGNDELLRKIKTFHYPSTHDYHTLLGFLKSSKYEVFIVGHSCGLSDKTLLNTIFENENCVAIKNFHFMPDGKEEDFYKRMAISRNFTDRQLFRMRVLPFDENARIPQLGISG